MSQNTSTSFTGLTHAQVEERRSKGLCNGELQVRTKSYRQILKDNTLTLFNLINVILLVCILLTGSFKNALFFLVVIWNFVIGTFQEIRAKKTIDRLSLLTSPKARVIREGEEQEIQVSDLVLDDLQILKNGSQIGADCVVLQGSCQVNESLLTGENDPILKNPGDHLLSGSFLISGQVLAQTEHVGADNYVNQITMEAKYYKKQDSVIMHSVRMIVRVLTVVLFPIAALQVWNNFFRLELPFNDAMIKTVASLSALIPGGLILLVSIVLAVSVLRLSAHHTLVQDLYSVENLARVDTLLLDKTGTITEGVMQTDQLIPWEDSRVDFDSKKALQFFVSHISDENATVRAIRGCSELPADEKDFSAVTQEQLLEIPFSSQRKWSLLHIDGRGSFILGAPEYILKEIHPNQKEKIREIASKGKRVVLFAYSQEAPCQSAGSEYQLPEVRIPLLLIVIGDRIRENARETFQFFEQEGVSIKVISGDSPLTVSEIAREAGIPQAERFVDAEKLTDDGSLAAAVSQYTVFGRVSPSQKLGIVKALKEQGHVVAMTGDGANDVLALKEADCSIAMQNGADAARNVSNLVLLDSDFSSLPLVVAEGRKSINNLQRSASLYLIKTAYSLLFAILFMISAKAVFPFENIQVTLIGAIAIGIPSFFLALEPRVERIRDHFLRQVFMRAIPTGILEAAAIYILVFRLQNLTPGITAVQISTACVYLMLIMGIVVVFNISGRLNWWKGGLVLFLILLAAGAVLLFPGLFGLTAIPGSLWTPILLFAAVFTVVHTIIIRLILPIIEKKRK